MEMLNYLKRIILAIFIFIMPVFFLPLTSEYYSTSKFYLLAIAVVLLIAINIVEIIIRKKARLMGSRLDIPLVVFLAGILVSTLISSTNKFQALVNLNLGFIPLLFVFAMYLFVSKSDEKTKMLIDRAIFYSSTLLSIITIVLFFRPFTLINLGASWQFLGSISFTPIGNYSDLILFLSFSLVYRALKRNFSTADVVMIAINTTAILLSVFTVIKYGVIAAPPYRLAWYSALEILKNPQTAFTGIGIDNFSVIFTRVKDLAYNQSNFWQVSSFATSRSVIMNILTETGLLGTLAFIFVLFTGFSVTKETENRSLMGIVVFWVLAVFIFPISFVAMTLLFITMGMMGKNSQSAEVDLEKPFPFYIAIAVILIGAVAGLSYLMGRNYLSEFRFKKSLDGLIANNAKEVYDNMRLARILNPYNERIILNFSQTNLIIANNMSQKEELSENDRLTIARAIQSSISEAKQLIRLNPNKAQYWENLANIYRTMIPIAEGADAWTISAYQRAIVLDPQNPSYRLALGSVYYLLNRYSEATSFFEQAVALKPDWANGYYNLAWTYYQNKEYEKAALSMQNVTRFIDKEASPDDFKKAEADLEQFKKQLPIEGNNTESTKELNLPTQPIPDIDPKIELPKEASPEAE